MALRTQAGRTAARVNGSHGQDDEKNEGKGRTVAPNSWWVK